MFKDGLIALFLPSENFFSDKVDSLTSKYKWIEHIVRSAKSIAAAMRGDYSSGKSDVLIMDVGADGAPVLTIPMSNTNTKFDYGDNFKVSFSWFHPYRQTVHAIISSFLWVVFIWNSFKHLPSIISGIGNGVTVTAGIGSAAKEEEE